jgi:hypothetical protein
VTTPQGSEWLPDREFSRRLETHATAQACATRDAACLDAWSRESGVAFSHVYVARRATCCADIGTVLTGDHDFALVYEGPSAWIFVRR